MFEAVPQELKERQQWVVWRSIVREGRVTKPPYCAANPNMLADVMNPATWGTFEQAAACYANNLSTVSGIGFVFSPDDDIFGIDIDDEAKVAPEHLEPRRFLVNHILSNAPTYAEISPSGTGLHIIGRGQLPGKGRRSAQLQIEIYGEGRFFTITGNAHNGHRELGNIQGLVDSMFTGYLAERKEAPLNMGVISTNRRTDMTDEEVIRAAANHNPNFAPRYNAQVDCEPGRWSETFMMVVGLLDQITGHPDQVRRIVMSSPMVLNSPPNGTETRLQKAERNFNTVLGRVRQNNTANLAGIEHGRQIFENMQRAKEERAREAVEKILAKSEEGFSKSGVELLKAFPLPGHALELSCPPGYVGEFVRATMGACFNPFLKFSIPATLSVLTGILGRSYKLPGGSGLNANFILAAPSATGKTQTMGAWEGFLTRAARSIDNTLAGPSRTRLIKASTSSIQGIFEDFMETPSAVWFISECSAQLSKMSDPKSAVDSQLRDAYNDLYDASQLGRFMSPPRSVANRKANLTAIENLSISTYWTTTTSKFDIFNDDAQDGFLSRVTIIRHNGAAGDVVAPWDLVSNLSDHLNETLVGMLGHAKRFDETFSLSPTEGAQLISQVSTEQVEAQAWAYQQIAERVKNAALGGSMPVAYTSVARLPPLAMRIAAVLAVVENPYTPSVTPEQYDWAFGYLLQNAAQLLSDMDTGQVGATMSQDVEVIIREMKRMLKRDRPADGSINSSALSKALRQLKPFRDQIVPGDAVARALSRMVADGLIAEFTPPVVGRGRPALKFAPTDDSAWLN